MDFILLFSFSIITSVGKKNIYFLTLYVLFNTMYYFYLKLVDNGLSSYIFQELSTSL